MDRAEPSAIRPAPPRAAGGAEAAALEGLARTAALACDRPRVLLRLDGHDRQWVRLAGALSPMLETLAARSFADAVEAAGPTDVADCSTDPRFKDEAWVAGPAGVRASAGVPVHGPGGRAIGALCVMDTRAGSLGARGSELLAEFARAIAEAVARQADAQAALAASDARLHFALAVSRLSLWELELPSGRVVLSAGWSQLLGGPAVASETTSVALMDVVPREDHPVIADTVRRLLKGQGDTYSVEHRVRRLDGTLAWVQSRGQVTSRSADGRVLRVIGTNHDVTQARQAAEELRLARDAADAGSRAKSRFLATISHEIRTPLNGILGLSRLLLDEPLQARGRQHAELLDGSAQTLLALVNDVLDLSKIEAGQLEIEQVTFNLHELVAEVATLYRLRASEKSLQFRLHLDPAVPRHVRADPGRIRQVLGNLLGNALKFTRRGWIGLHAGVVADAGEPTLEFVVSDTGIGIAKELQPQLFKPFVQADTATARKYGGTGLGLSIVKQLCEAMGGSVRVRSREGKGTRFIVLLPHGEPAPDHASNWQDVLPAAAPARVLVAEDNPVNQLVVMGMLGKLGYVDVGLANDGRQALALGSDNGFDIILMDCNMPEMDGYEATQRLREAGCTAAIVAMTANAIKGDRERCLAAGMDDYLTKPLGLREFGETLAAWGARGSRSTWSTLSPADDLAEATQAADLPPPAPPEPPVFDVTASLERHGGDEELLGASVHSFLELMPRELDRLAQAARDGDTEQVRRRAHSAKGAAAMVGAERLAALAVQLEVEGVSLGAPELARRLAALRAALADYEAAVRPAA